MQIINKTINVGSVPVEPDTSKLRLMLLKSIISGSAMLGCFGAIIHLVNPDSNITKSTTVTQQADGKANKVQTPTKQLEAPTIITKKPNKPIVIEEGSEAWFCIQNNGGDGCLTRNRFVLNYQVVSREKTYEDRLVEYGIRPMNINNCPPEIAWQPNCQY